MKRDTRVAGPWKGEDLRRWEGWEGDYWNVYKTLMAWQEDLLTLLEGNVDNREICYICEKEGCTGKSAFYMRKHHRAVSYT